MGKKSPFRFRNIFMILGVALVLTALVLTDVDDGIQTVMMLGGVASGVIAVAIAHIARKGLMDYPSADMEKLFRKAGEEPTGAGLALVAMAIILYGLLSLFGPRAHAQDIRTFIPPQAMQYLPTVKVEIDRYWADHPARGFIGATIEHESGCFALKRMCWNPRAQLKTQREEGAGFGQITRAYRTDGTQRFDALQEMVDRYPQLKGWNWGNVYDRADYQLRAVVLKLRQGYTTYARTVKDPYQAVLFTDAGYNGGDGGVQSERRACGLKAGCNPQRWYGNVELVCLKSKAPIYGTRSACDINRHHVRDVEARALKYIRWLT